jgi:hypothetical protein
MSLSLVLLLPFLERPFLNLMTVQMANIVAKLTNKIVAVGKDKSRLNIYYILYFESAKVVIKNNFTTFYYFLQQGKGLRNEKRRTGVAAGLYLMNGNCPPN